MSEVPKGHEPYEAKMGYVYGPGYVHRSTAYIDSRDLETGRFYGTNKHSDEPVVIAWSDGVDGCVLVSAHE